MFKHPAAPLNRGRIRTISRKQLMSGRTRKARKERRITVSYIYRDYY